MTLERTQAMQRAVSCDCASAIGSCSCGRRGFARALCAVALGGLGSSHWAMATPSEDSGSARMPAAGDHPDVRWFDAARQMQSLAESWGDQSYGAVLVLDGRLVGSGPSRVVLRGDPSAHAEREAIRDAQRRLQRRQLQGSVLYSTSRPCRACEAAAAAAGVGRMYFGAGLVDAGAPRSARRVHPPGELTAHVAGPYR